MLPRVYLLVGHPENVKRQENLLTPIAHEGLMFFYLVNYSVSLLADTSWWWWCSHPHTSLPEETFRQHGKTTGTFSIRRWSRSCPRATTWLDAEWQTLSQRCPNACPTSEALDKHWDSVGSASRVRKQRLFLSFGLKISFKSFALHDKVICKILV